MKLKILGFALLAVCVCAVCCMCGSDSKTPDYEFPDGPDPDPDPQPGDYPAGLTVTEFADDLGGGKQCLGFVAVADLKANPKLRFNAVHLPQQKTPSRIHAEFASANRGTACVTTNAGYWWAGNSLSLLVTGGAVKSIENQTVTRNNQTVYPVRSSFGQMASGGFETHWIYCVLDDGNKPYAFPSALDNDERTNTYMSAPPTSKTPGAALWTPQEAVGGGPMLVREGKNVAVENYWKEVFDGGGIAGTSRVGSNCFLAGQVGVADHVTIGNRVKVGSKSGIDKDVPDGEIRLGYPALPGMQYHRAAAVFKVLPELARQVRELEKEIETLKKQ